MLLNHLKRVFTRICVQVNCNVVGDLLQLFYKIFTQLNRMLQYRFLFKNLAKIRPVVVTNALQYIFVIPLIKI